MAPDGWPTGRPSHWCSEGRPPVRVELRPWCEEGMAICSYFYEAMPEGIQVERVERWENQAVRVGLGPAEEVELWLFHGTDAVDAVLENGFRISHAQLDSRHNRYGVGVYFARDPRLAHHFAQMSKSGKQTEICQVILARVVVGRCALKAPLKDQRQLLRPEHREPPTGFHSCTSNSAPGREVVVFPGSPGTPAYPAYVITYRMPRDSTRSTSLGNPYREQLLRVDFEDRASSQAFHRYQHHWRATLPRELRAERAERADGSAVRKAGQVPQPLSRRNSCEERRPATQRLASKRPSSAPRMSRRPGAERPAEPEPLEEPVPSIAAPETQEAPKEVPVKTLWIFDEEKSQKGVEVEVPLSCQARRRSAFAAAWREAAWHPAPPLPLAAAKLAAAQVPDMSAVMALGGADATGCSLDAVHVIDKGSFTWTALPPLSTPRQALASAATGGHVYALGGSWSATRSSVVATVEMFDVGTEQWVDVAPFQVPRAYHAAAAHEGRIYVVGGLNTEGRRLKSVECMDPREGIWRPAPSLLSPRSALATAVLDGLYALGGAEANTGAASARVEHLNVRMGSWMSVSPMPTARQGLAASALGGRHGVLLAIGGRRGAALSAVERYWPHSAAAPWATDCAPLPFPSRSALAAAALDEQTLLVLGGQADRGSTAPSPLSVVERYELHA
ncbi:unnamed protein product [Durusdinium trenchii]|uniref:PARP catalytic domain-containing protein n=1 Tax=Durusdinium trenchii TaxID=1381693 RepID=A0ABP0HX59_9DINO